MGQRVGLSYSDVRKINAMYNCKGLFGLPPNVFPKLPGKPAATLLTGVGNLLSGKK